MTEINCMSCGAPENAEHLLGCPVMVKLAELALMLRVHPDPANWNSVNFELEKVPEGPIMADGGSLGLGDAIVCGGVTLKSVAANIPGMGFTPGVVFQFHTVRGGRLQPIVFMTEKHGDFLNIKVLLNKAVNAATRAARMTNDGGTN